MFTEFELNEFLVKFFNGSDNEAMVLFKEIGSMGSIKVNQFHSASLNGKSVKNQMEKILSRCFVVNRD